MRYLKLYDGNDHYHANDEQYRYFQSGAVISPVQIHVFITGSSRDSEMLELDSKMHSELDHQNESS